MEKWKLNDLEQISAKKGIIKQKVPHTFSAQSVQLTIESGAILPVHSTPIDVLFYVIKGSGLVTIGDEIQECGEGSYIESPKDIPHGWENNSNEKLKVLVIKLY